MKWASVQGRSGLRPVHCGKSPAWSLVARQPVRGGPKLRLKDKWYCPDCDTVFPAKAPVLKNHNRHQATDG